MTNLVMLPRFGILSTNHQWLTVSTQVVSLEMDGWSVGGKRQQFKSEKCVVYISVDIPISWNFWVLINMF